MNDPTMIMEPIPPDWMPYVDSDPNLTACKSLVQLKNKLQELSQNLIKQDAARYVMCRYNVHWFIGIIYVPLAFAVQVAFSTN